MHLKTTYSIALPVYESEIKENDEIYATLAKEIEEASNEVDIDAIIKAGLEGQGLGDDSDDDDDIDVAPVREEEAEVQHDAKRQAAEVPAEPEMPIKAKPKKKMDASDAMVDRKMVERLNVDKEAPKNVVVEVGTKKPRVTRKRQAPAKGISVAVAPVDQSKLRKRA